ncbi:hypothetical protein U472_07840 [Orenia metallireducens]|uniref:Uncharacterized protein n=1 Tax=Orenia metallireducens TaxID=1413210 RepID=A0A1C0AAQ0_9FIRM|nr:hypothetical protein [Orenia metallireducens]OCL27362.1 hypothetical protein U472_07840 [Orenia metallireducens]
MVNSLTTGVFLAIILAVLGVLFLSEFLKAMMVLMEEVDNNVLNQGSIYLKIVSASMIFGLPIMISLIIVVSIILLLVSSSYHAEYKKELKDKEEYIIMESSNFLYKAYSADYISWDDN